VAAVVALLLAGGLVLALQSGGRGGHATAGYDGKQLTLDRGTRLSALALGRDGTLYVLVDGDDDYSGALYKITKAGELRSVAGIGPAPAASPTSAAATASPAPVPPEGIKASKLMLDDPRALAVAPDGTVYVADYRADQVYRITPAGRAFVLAGAGPDEDGFTADSGRATRAELQNPSGLAVGPDGSVYLAEGTRVRKISKDGLISTVAGSYSHASTDNLGDGGLATAASLPAPTALAVGADGTVYVADGTLDTVREITPDGGIRTAAGVPNRSGATGDGGPATAALLNGPAGLAIGRDGSLYIADTQNEKLRRVDRRGVITTVAGSGHSTGLDGTLATEADLSFVYDVAVDPSGALFATMTYDGTLIRIDPTNHFVQTILTTPKH
jgi:serine/threonine-protein kinase